MIESNDQKRLYYNALLDKNTEFDGVFFAGIKTTGVFCHPSCTARKPKFENCEFYQSAEEALLRGYRPCKICNPLSYPQELPDEVKLLVEAIENNPEKKWKDYDFKQLGLNSVSVRRKFKKVYGMTFVQYARSRRIGLAFKAIKRGSKVIDQQLNAGFDSASGFNDAFTKIMGNPSTKIKIKLLNANFIETPIGRMISISDDDFLYLLEFENRRGLETEIFKLRKKQNARLIYGATKISILTTTQIQQYFNQKLDQFTIPLCLDGSVFQKKVWNILINSKQGEHLTYKEIATELGDKNKSQAVGNANGANQIAIVVPCHRVINSNGEIGGYGGGIERKKYLLTLEFSKKETP
ncbi:bifunctional transcriptional activator/DNA repair enzyme AdaA [Leuconostoc citreum]